MVLQRIRQWARMLQRDVVALWLAARDPRVPWYVKALAGAVAAYALSPVDLIPDFIPVFGYLDDLVIVPLGVWATLRLIPVPLMMEFRAEAAKIVDRPTSRVGFAVIVVIWVGVVSLAAWWVSVRWSTWPMLLRQRW